MVQDGTRRDVPARRQRVLRHARRRRSAPAIARRSPSTTTARPQIAKNPPWDGGFIWANDSLGRPWVVTTDQGLGASVWWPNKDTQADEPDSQRVAITVPDSMIGRLERPAAQRRRTTPTARRRTSGSSTNPINNYAIAVNAGHYAHFTETYDGETGKLTMDFWPLAYHLDTAQRQFQQARSMLQCFEHWFGPYPWYEDGYKLVEAPHLGMEHQSAVAYGNWFQNGYLGRDLLGHRAGAQVGLHHRPRERARVVRQQHHGEGQRRHVGPRELRQLRRGHLHRVPGRARRRARSTSSATAAASGTTARSFRRTA